MNVGIVGARKYQDRQSVLDLVMSLPADATIITSSCKGVCTWMKKAAEERGMKVLVFAPYLENIRAWFDIPNGGEVSHRIVDRGVQHGPASPRTGVLSAG